MQLIRSAVLASLVVATLAADAVAQVITIDTVSVGDPGNPANSTGFGPKGGVGYSYNIGKYEVTNTQYAAFLNAVATTDSYSLYNSNLAGQYGGITQTGSSGSYTYAVKSGFENKAVNYVSFWDATRFTNWLNNGQGGASTDTGSYTLTSEGITNNTVTRNAGAIWAVASEDEWYKAAYFQPAAQGGDVDDYWLYPTKSNIIDPADANYGASSQTDVGSYPSKGGFYGTLDQAGSVYEWNETILGGRRGLLGGSWADSEAELRSSSLYRTGATFEGERLGFRVVNLAPIPEPSAYAAALGGVALGLGLLRRRRPDGSC